jgi:hypothetical protein
MLEVYNPVPEDMGGGLSFVIRVAGEPTEFISAVRTVVAEVTEPTASQPDDDGTAVGKHHDLPTIEHGPARRLRGSSAAAFHPGHLRRHVVRRGATPARDRRADGLGRAREQRADADHQWRVAADAQISHFIEVSRRIGR